MSSAAQREIIPFSHVEQLREARSIIRHEADALVGLSSRLDADFCTAVDTLSRSTGSVIVTGMGKAGLIGQKIAATLSSTGTRAHPTVTGQFLIYRKSISTPMAGPGYYLPGVPYTMYFYKGYALHGTYWHNNFGRPMSHGCVNLTKTDASWLYSWARVGTPVVVRW